MKKVVNPSSIDHSVALSKIANENKIEASNVQVIVCSSEEELRDYHAKKSIDPQYRCNVCSKRYTSHSSLKNHKIRHKEKDDLPYYCMFCPFRAAAKRDLLRHHDQHIGHARQIFKCLHCNKTFKNSSSLNEHTKSVHIKDMLYKCGLCSFTCWRRSGFRLHLKYHHTKVQIICPICDATFQSKSNLQIHLMSHAGAKPFACDKCDKRFTVKNQLAGHQQRVHSPKAFDCELCQKRFPTVHHLKRHSLIHTGERPFKCCFCSYDSNTQGNLMKHVRRVHRLFHFTYKDILMKSGLIEDQQKSLTFEDIKRMTDRGRETSEVYIKSLREKGLTTASLEQLEKEMILKRKSKEELVQSRTERKQKQKKVKNTTLRKNSEIKTEIPKERKTKKGKEKIGFNFPNCNEFLPRIEDGIQPQNNGGVEVLSTTAPTTIQGLATTPTIQVIWNVNYSHNVEKSSINKKPPKQKKSQKIRTKNRKSVKQKVMLCNSVVDEQGEFCRQDSSPNSPSSATLTLDVAPPTDNDQPPSNMLEDNDLAFTGKPVLHHLQESNNMQSCTSSALVTPLDPELVGFEEIGAPNTVVVTSDGISYIDKVYKNLDLCNQFLHINDDETHFINTFDSNLQRDSKVSRSDGQMYSNMSRDQRKGKRSNEEILSCSDLSKETEIDHTFKTNNGIQISCYVSKMEKADQFPTTNHHLHNIAKENNNNTSIDESNLVIDIEPMENTISEDLDMCKTESEEVLLFDENSGTCGMISSLLFIPEEDTSSQPLKEIVIKGYELDQRLCNDVLEVTSIAEIEENEAEVVLVIDASS